MTECRCIRPPFYYLDYETVSLGVDETNGRYGEVTVETCKACGSVWLRYLIEYEFFKESGRWYRGRVTQELVESLKPEEALDILSSLPSYFYGGSYFRTLGRVGSGPVCVDL